MFLIGGVLKPQLVAEIGKVFKKINPGSFDHNQFLTLITASGLPQRVFT
jgi:hypothetical protein